MYRYTDRKGRREKTKLKKKKRRVRELKRSHLEEHMPAIRENTLYIFKYKEMEYKKTYYTITYITNFIMREKFLQQTFIRNSSFFYVCNFYGLLLTVEKTMVRNKSILN